MKKKLKLMYGNFMYNAVFGTEKYPPYHANQMIFIILTLEEHSKMEEMDFRSPFFHENCS